jgi:hypothetical protein
MRTQRSMRTRRSKVRRSKRSTMADLLPPTEPDSPLPDADSHLRILCHVPSTKFFIYLQITVPVPRRECTPSIIAISSIHELESILLEAEPRQDQLLIEIFDDEKSKLKKFIQILLISLEYLAFLLQKILQYLLIFCKYAEFPNRRRPKCTTMPWNIWPSLVVLWGVCWMFYPGSSYLDGTPYQFPLNDELLSTFGLGKTPSYTI